MIISTTTTSFIIVCTYKIFRMCNAQNDGTKFDTKKGQDYCSINNY